MGRRAILAVLLLPLSAFAQSIAPADDGAARFGLKPRAPAFGLHLNQAPEPATRPPGAQFVPAPGAYREGWAAFGAMGPMRWAQPLREDANMAWRIGGGRTPGIPSAAETAGLPKRMNIGLQYRF